jgi:hypothetical protein
MLLFTRPEMAVIPPCSLQRGKAAFFARRDDFFCTAWALAFLDLHRILLPMVVAPTDDRTGPAWRSRLTYPKGRLTDWTARVLCDAVPVPVFNDTAVEAGQRVLCDPVLGPAGVNHGPAAP